MRQQTFGEPDVREYDGAKCHECLRRSVIAIRGGLPHRQRYYCRRCARPTWLEIAGV